MQCLSVQSKVKLVKLLYIIDYIVIAIFKVLSIDSTTYLYCI